MIETIVDGKDFQFAGVADLYFCKAISISDGLR